MAVYQDKARERIQQGLRRFRNVVAKATANKANEADTRVVVNAILGERPAGTSSKMSPVSTGFAAPTPTTSSRRNAVISL